MRLKKIIYFIKEQPHNAAAYNRVRMLSEGINSNHIISKIIFIPKHNGNSASYYFKYILFLFQSFLLFFFSSKSTAFILYGEDAILKYLVKFPRKGLLIVERTEYSTYLYDNSLDSGHIASIKQFEASLKYVDGMIVCSDALNRHYHQYCEKPFCMVPLVYEEGFIRCLDSKDNHTIVYCGDMGGGKDGVDVLIKAFGLFCQEIHDYKLVLIGGTKDPDVMNNLKQLVVDLDIADKTTFTGWVNRNDLPEYLERASLLVLSRPSNKQAEGGIPSKLAEYLSTGRPVLTTNVGDLHKYFTHAIDLFFAIPGSVEDFAEKMKSIVKDYNHSCIVGRTGRETVKQFNKILQARTIIEYVKTMQG